MFRRASVGIVGISCLLNACSAEQDVSVIKSEPVLQERVRSEMSDRGYVDAQRDECGRGRRVLLEPFMHNREEYNHGYRHGKLLIEQHPELCAIVRALLPEVVEV